MTYIYCYNLRTLEWIQRSNSCIREDIRELSQIRYSLVVILELNGVSEVQYKDMMMIDDGKYQ